MDGKKVKTIEINNVVNEEETRKYAKWRTFFALKNSNNFSGCKVKYSSILFEYNSNYYQIDCKYNKQYSSMFSLWKREYNGDRKKKKMYADFIIRDGGKEKVEMTDEHIISNIKETIDKVE